MVMHYLREEVDEMERALQEEALQLSMKSKGTTTLLNLPTSSRISVPSTPTSPSSCGYHFNDKKTNNNNNTNFGDDDERKPLLTRPKSYSFTRPRTITPLTPNEIKCSSPTKTSIQCLSKLNNKTLDEQVISKTKLRSTSQVALNLTSPRLLSSDIKEELEVWKRAQDSVKDDKSVRKVLRKKVAALESRLRKRLREEKINQECDQNDYRLHLQELERKYKIKNKPLLVKSCVVMVIVIMLFFLQSLPEVDMSLGWIAIIGSVALLVLADFEDLDHIISRIEWSTLLFFAALFVVMEALTELKLLYFIGQVTQKGINSFSSDYQLLAGVNILLWVSSLASSFIDNIPFATVMVKILEDMARDPGFSLPLTPLVYALAFGSCLGGNGTLIGASANVVCAGVAEQHGYRITFRDFFK